LLELNLSIVGKWEFFVLSRRKRTERTENDHQEIVVSTESEGTDGPQEEEEEEAPPETPSTLAQAMEMMRKLHLFASVQQPQLHEAVSVLESRLTDIYLDSKCVVQSKIEDYFVKS
jgi:hypothetical protein